MNRDLIHVLLNTTDKNNRLERSLLQGSTNKTFVLSLLDNEKLVKLDSSVAEVSVAVLYNPRMINSKLVYDGSYIETKTDTGYDITISDETLNGVDFSMINIPFKEEFVTYAGNCKLIIRVESNGINMYTYSMDYTVDLNEGYFSTSIPNNLPKFEDVKRMVADVQTALNSTNTKVSTNTNEIASAKSDIATRAKADLSNVGDFSSSPDGAILYKKDGQLKSTGLTVLGNVINASGKRLQVDEIDTNPNTLNLGKNISVHENGGFIEYHTNTLNKDFLLMDYENDPINGTQKPIYYKRGTKKNVIIQSAETTLMSDVKTINVPSVSVDRQIQTITLNFNKALNNFCMEFIVNGKPVAYYPSLNAWNGLENGYTIVKGRNNLQLKPFFSSMKEYSYKINIKASSTVDLMGNGVLPYYALTFNEIERLNVALEEDISPEKTRDSLQTLTGDNRLDSSAIKNLTSSKTTVEIARDLEGLAVGSKLDYTKALDNLPNIPSPETGDTVKTKLESLIGDNRLNASAIKNLPSGLDTNVVSFKKEFSINAINKTGNQINAGSFVFLAPVKDGTFKMEVITQNTGYKGELFGYLKSSVSDNSFGDVSLITTIATGVSGKTEGELAYLGYNGSNLEIGDLNTVDNILGSCGVFGETNDIGENLVLFNSFETQTSRMIQEHHNKDVAYYDTLPAVINNEALIIYLVGSIVSSGGTVFQQLPALSSVVSGTEIIIDNLKSVYGSKITLQAYGTDKINDKSTYDVSGQTVISIIATKSGWVKIYDSSIKGSGLTIDQTHGDYRQKSAITKISLHAPLDVTFYDDTPDLAGLSINPTAFSDTKFSNVDQTYFDSKLNASRLYQELKNKVPSRVNDVYKYYEETGSVDFSSLNADIIHVVYQITSENEVIQQTLPSTTTDKIIFIETIYSTGITQGTVRITPNAGEQINGATQSIDLEGNKAHGILFPENLNWDYIPFEETSHNFGLEFDDNTNSVAGVTKVNLKNISISNISQDNKELTLTADGSLTGVDKDKREFDISKIQSLDKSIRISNLGSGVCDLSKGLEDHNEGILAFLGNDQMLNSKFGRAKLYFGDIRVNGGSYVYENLTNKSFVLQDTDPQDDPNKSGGTTFIIGLYYEPDSSFENTVTENGTIELELVDENDNPIIDVNGNPMGSKFDYKAGDSVGKEIYFGEVQIKSYTEVHLKVKMDFATEQLISVGSNTCILIQSTKKDESGGLALLSFMAYTGYRLEFDTKYYGDNSLNLARALVFPEPETLINNESINLGQNLYLDVATKAKVSINNYRLNISDNNFDIPVFNITKFYNVLDSHYISGKQYKVTATLTDKQNAFRIALLHYTGTDSIPERPKVLSYNNMNPVFTADWEVVDSMFITEDTVSGEHTQSKTFTIPDNSKGLAIIMYAVTASAPLSLSLKDLEGDITPWFNKVIIKDNSHISEKYMEQHDYIYRSIVKTPSGDVSYRFTSNSTDTKVPVGNVSGGDGKIINNNAWTDAGSSDPNKVQGDLKFLADGNVTINYTIQCYNEQSTLNQVQFWLAKVNGDGTFTEVPNSKIATTIEANRVKPKMVSSPKFTFEVNQNDSYRLFMKSDKDDGFFIESKTDGVPMVRLDIDFKEVTEFEQNTLDKLNFLDGEIVITQEAQDAGWYIELDYNTTTQKPSLSPKQRVVNP